MRTTPPLRGLTGLLAAALAALVIQLSSASAVAQPAAASPTTDARTALSTITVEARRLLKRQVDHYVSTVVVHYQQDSLVRWDSPVCPLVAGMPRERGEFLLWRISQIAREARVPLAGEHCTANLYVIVTPEPDLLLKKWLRRNPTMYSTSNGMAGVNSFLNSARPIRCWYNTEFRGSDGAAASADAFAAGLSGSGLEMVRAPVVRARAFSRLTYSALQSLSSVIIVADLNRVQQLKIGQLADYVALVGLAEVRPDAELGDAPSILRLFDDSGESQPAGLSAWDQAFLYSLYNTSRASVMQASLIKTSMLQRMAPR
jgi:hypothetical protein